VLALVRIRPQRNEAGFSLIELLVVATIIIALSLFAMPVFAKVTDKARYAKSAEDLRVIEEQLEVYQADKGHYPDSLVRLIEQGYIKDTTQTHDRLKSPWYSNSNRVYYFYAVDQSAKDSARAYLLGDPGPTAVCGGGGMPTRATLSADGPIPCGRNPDTETGAYVWGGSSPTLMLVPNPDALFRTDLKSSL
jgi:type II secretory pathway pseudopilin PulG